MPKHHLGYRPSSGSDGDAMLIEMQEFETALHEMPGDAAALAQIERDQIARDIDAIERATAALRRGEPALETCAEISTDDPPVVTMRKPRPVWLMIGLLWLSTALVTAGAVAAIAKLVG